MLGVWNIVSFSVPHNSKPNQTKSTKNYSKQKTHFVKEILNNTVAPKIKNINGEYSCALHILHEKEKGNFIV